MSTNSVIVCKCAEIIMKSDGHESKIRSKILIVRNGDVLAVCKGCGTEVNVPLQAASSGPPLILTK